MQVESDMNHSVSQVVASVGIPLMIYSSSQKALGKLESWVTDEIADSEKSAKDNKSYLSFLVKNLPTEKRHLIPSHLAHVIISTFPTTAALMSWTTISDSKSVDSALNETVQAHPPVLTRHILTITLELEGFKLKTGTTIATSPLALQGQLSISVSDLLPVPCLALVKSLVKAGVNELRGKTVGEAQESLYAHMGVPWVRGVTVQPHAKEE